MSESQSPAADEPMVTSSTLEAEYAEAEVPAEAPKITADMQVAAARGVDAAFAAIHKQPKVKIRIPKLYGPQTVIINGARFDIASNVFVEVPEQVAQILADAGRI